MTKRIQTLCSLLVPSETFADIGCDHGYCTEYMLKNHLCRHAVLSDVSKGSLQKAERLLADYIAEGVCSSNCADGLCGISPDTEQVLIAGMGGLEIVKILQNGFLPKRFVLQPMRDSELLRRFLAEHGCAVERDFTFADEKFYDVICGRSTGGSVYTDLEYAYGKENLAKKPSDFLDKLRFQTVRWGQLLPRLPEEERREREKRIAEMQRILDEAE